MTPVATGFACRELRLRQYRNFERLDLELPAAGVALIGDNGAGKTNLLEALYYLEIFRSFRDVPDERLVRFGEDTFFVRGLFEETGGRGATREITAGYDRRARRKRVTVDGSEVERLGDALGAIGAVVFAPSDLALVAGGPAERRRYLDIMLSLSAPAYLAALQRYRHVLRQRTALLRQQAERIELAPWDDALVETGAEIILARARWTEERAAGFADRVTAIGGGSGAALAYASSVPLPARLDVAELRSVFAAMLQRLAPRERERGVTLAGPHRDELTIRTAGGVDLRDFGSGGQRRTAAIALRMVEADTIRETRRVEPIVLLDDVFAELDPGRSGRILELLEAEGRGQVILTAPKRSDVEPRGGMLEHWRVQAGQVLR
jgi:DNA replication and repair protein RecF